MHLDGLWLKKKLINGNVLHLRFITRVALADACACNYLFIHFIKVLFVYFKLFFL